MPKHLIKRYQLDRIPNYLLTVGNPKTVKGEKSGYYTAIMHLAPADLSGRNVCAFASPGCIAACLNKAGRGGMALDKNGLNKIQVARIQRTRWFARDRAAFMLQLAVEIEHHIQRAIRLGLKPCIRLNGTSDIPWENVRLGKFRNIFAMFPDVQFYDYTKAPVDTIRKGVAAIPNYHLTFSLSETNVSVAARALRAGVNVAVPYFVKRSGELPHRAIIDGVQTVVIDGDKSDLRFLDQDGLSTGKIVGLRVKGSPGKADESGFIQTPNYNL